MKPPLTLEFLRSTFKRNYSLAPDVCHLVCLQAQKSLKMGGNPVSPYPALSSTRK